MPQPLVLCGSVKPVLLQGMIIVLAFIIQVCLSSLGNTFPGQFTGYPQGSAVIAVALVDANAVSATMSKVKEMETAI